MKYAYGNQVEHHKSRFRCRVAARQQINMPLHMIGGESGYDASSVSQRSANQVSTRICTLLARSWSSLPTFGDLKPILPSIGSRSVAAPGCGGSCGHQQQLTSDSDHRSGKRHRQKQCKRIESCHPCHTSAPGKLRLRESSTIALQLIASLANQMTSMQPHRMASRALSL